MPVLLAPVEGLTLILYQAFDPAGAVVVVDVTVPDPLLSVSKVLVPAVYVVVFTGLVGAEEVVVLTTK